MYKLNFFYYLFPLSIVTYYTVCYQYVKKVRKDAISSGKLKIVCFFLENLVNSKLKFI